MESKRLSSGVGVPISTVVLSCAFLAIMSMCSYLAPMRAGAAEDEGGGGKWDFKKQQGYQLNVYQIKPPEGVGTNYHLKIGQTSKTTELLGNVTNSATVAGGTYTSPTLTTPTITDPVIDNNVQTETGTTVTLTAADSGSIFYQSKGIVQTYALPADPTGLEFTFVKDSIATEMNVDPNGTDLIANADTPGDYYGSVTPHSLIKLVGVSTTTWVNAQYSGTWYTP